VGSNVYVFKAQHLGMRLKRNLSTTCKRCGELILVGDQIYSKVNNTSRHGANYNKLYHLSCWEALQQ
jgi:anaerobic glycerol-3-phosphate dehydrogenase